MNLKFAPFYVILDYTDMMRIRAPSFYYDEHRRPDETPLPRICHPEQ